MKNFDAVSDQMDVATKQFVESNVNETIPVRENSKAYVVGDRVLYPVKYGWVLSCSTAGTTGASLPAWPTTIVSGGTTITDGSAVWTVYDMTSDTQTPVINNLTSTSTTSALSAYQGKVLNDGKQRNLATATLSSGAIDLATADVFSLTVTSNISFSVSNAKACSIFTLRLTNGGAYTVTFPANTKWSDGIAPALTVSGTDVLTFMTIDGGSSWIGFKSAINIQ